MHLNIFSLYLLLHQDSPRQQQPAFTPCRLYAFTFDDISDSQVVVVYIYVYLLHPHTHTLSLSFCVYVVC